MSSIREVALRIHRYSWLWADLLDPQSVLGMRNYDFIEKLERRFNFTRNELESNYVWVREMRKVTKSE